MGEELGQDTDHRAVTATDIASGKDDAENTPPLEGSTAAISTDTPADTTSTPGIAVPTDTSPPLDHAEAPGATPDSDLDGRAVVDMPAPLATVSEPLVNDQPEIPPTAAPHPDIAPNVTPDKALMPVASVTLPVEAPEGHGATRLARSATVLLLVAGVAAVAGGGVLALALTQGDWGSGARAAGIACLALGTVCLLVMGLRSVLGRRRVAWGGIAVVLICGLLGGSGLAEANPLRVAQGHQLEANHDWAGALRAYLLAGEQGTASADPARVYVEWGDALARQGDYAAAIDRYEQAISRYPDAQNEAQRAIAGLWPAYNDWLDFPSDSLPYLAIIQDLHGYQQSDWCMVGCRTSAAALEAQTRFAYGQQLTAGRQYALAIKYLESVAATDPSGPYVARAHMAAAIAYLALGLSELHGPNCATALPTYQTLISAYKDTPEGKRAAAALAAPVTVSGRLTGYPNNPAPTMYLSTKMFSISHFSDDYNTTLDAAGGFTFTQVSPGTYNLSAAFDNGAGRYWQVAKSSNPYAVKVAPLCTLNLGTYSW